LKRRIIVGIDPGTTTAWAVLDLDGNKLHVGSSKGMGLSALISVITFFGRPLIVGCDKKKIPGFVDEFARKFGARVANPRDDLKVEFKRNLVSGIAFENTHEMDALASAIFAQKEMNPLLDRVKRFIEKEDISRKKNENPEESSIGIERPSVSAAELFETVLTTGISIKEAASLLEEEESLSGTGNEDLPPAKKTRAILSILRAAQKESEILKDHNEQLAKESNQWKQRTKSLEGIMKSLRTKRAPDTSGKDATITHLRKTISKLQNENGQSRKTIEGMQKILLDVQSHVVAIMMENLGTEELERVLRWNNIDTTSIIFVKRPTHVNSRVVDRLKAVQPLLLCDERVKNHPLPFVCIKGTPRVMLGKIAVFPADRVSAQVDEANLIHRVVGDYKKERVEIKLE